MDNEAAIKNDQTSSKKKTASVLATFPKQTQSYFIKQKAETTKWTAIK